MNMIYPLSAFNDNYIWCIQASQGLLVVDPGDAKPVLTHLANTGMPLLEIWITHHHNDHIGGVKALQAAYPNVLIRGSRFLQSLIDVTNIQDDGSAFQISDKKDHCLDVTVWDTPGHTASHQVYLLQGENQLHVFCGDTLFSAGCGRVFDGTIEDLYQSFERFKTLPENTLFYPAHEYTAANLGFALAVEPENADVQAALQSAKEQVLTLPVTLEHERRVNPFLRIDEKTVLAGLIQEGCSPRTPEDVFSALRTWKNRF